MSITVEAIYENGVLRLSEPLPFKERQKVQVTIRPKGSPLLDSYGIMGYNGSVEDADYFATDPELDVPPPAEQP
jgi:predicted DNA-binding antitoxin AbrB/MazE fold protein